MEIVIKIDGELAAAAAQAGQGGAQLGSQATGPMADLAARAQALGAIDAGPANISTVPGQPLADIAAMAPRQPPAGADQGGALPAGAAPGYGEEAASAAVEVSGSSGDGGPQP